MSRVNELELSRDDHTDYIFDEICFGEPVLPETAQSVSEGVARAVELNERPIFLEGLAERLTELGTVCNADDSCKMIDEVRRRYKAILGKPCPKAVQNWVRGTTPGTTNRENNYELCIALEMDFREIAVFFQKHFLTLPWNCKAKADAVFLYCIYHRKTYSKAQELLRSAGGFVPQENAHTATSQIYSTILSIDDDEKFLRYLSAHCYDNEQQFQLARRIINAEIGIVQDRLLKYESDRVISPDRLGSLTVEALLGFKYQKSGRRIKDSRLPKRFTESLPNDVTLGKIVNGGEASYELLRKTLMLLKFYNFYYEADNSDEQTIGGNLMDFYDEQNAALISCGFAQLYVRHPFDGLLLYCANSFDPIDTLYCVMENGRN